MKRCAFIHCSVINQFELYKNVLNTHLLLSIFESYMSIVGDSIRL